jgi:predicted DNA-binding transcriptional regulator AlpA
MQYGIDKRKKLVTMPQILAELGISRTKFLGLVATGKFPAPLKDSGGHTNLWLDTHSQDYIDNLIVAAEASAIDPQQRGASDVPQ